MVRAIVGVIVGYLVMAIVVVVAFAAAFMIMGVEGSYKPGSWEVSPAWMVMSFAVGGVAAVIGGLLCALIASRGSRAPFVFATIVLVLGLLQAGLAMASSDEETPPRPEGEVAMADAMQYSKPPTISLLINPFIGAVGILLGARLRGGSEPLAAAP